MILDVFYLLLLGVSTDNFDCSKLGDRQIISSFDHAVRLNESFKYAVITRQESQISLRREVEGYAETVLEPCVGVASERVVSKPDSELLRSLVDLSVSYVNSSEEAIPAALVRIYLARPDDLLNELRRLDKTSASVVIRALLDALKMEGEALNGKILRDRQARLNVLIREKGL